MTNQENQFLEENWDEITSMAIGAASRQVIGIQRREKVFDQLKPCIILAMMWFVASNFLITSVFKAELAQYQATASVNLKQLGNSVEEPGTDTDPSEIWFSSFSQEGMNL